MDALEILFWNVHGMDIDSIQIEFNNLNIYPDIIILAEISKDIDTLSINETLYSRQLIKTKDKVLSVFIKESTLIFELNQIDNQFNTNCSLGFYFPLFSIFAVHLPSKRSNDAISQLSFAFELANKIRNYMCTAESQEIDSKPFQNVIIIGDFNMNPYEQGMILPVGFHAPYSRKEFLDKPHSRDIHRIRYPYFYNPAWAWMGEANKSIDTAQGTYFLESSTEHYSLSWNILDQVLVHASLVEKIVDSRILKIDNGAFQPMKFDHLPIYLKIKYV